MLVYLGLEIADSADKEATVNKKGTILLLSGELDKAVAAFIIATGFAALGVEMKMSIVTIFSWICYIQAPSDRII